MTPDPRYERRSKAAADQYRELPISHYRARLEEAAQEENQ